jgi:hypothetical protein
VMTDAFAELCEQDTVSGYNARQVLRAAMVGLAHGTPNCVIRPRSLAEVTDALDSLVGNR